MDDRTRRTGLSARSERRKQGDRRPRVAVVCFAHSVGDERVVQRQALSLAEEGYEVTVYARGDRRKKLPSHPNLVIVPILDMIYGPSVIGRLARLRAAGRVRRLLAESPPEIISCHEPDSALFAVVALRPLGCAVHFDVHELWEEIAANRFPRLLAGPVRRIATGLLRWVARRCEWVTVVAPGMTRLFEGCGPTGRAEVLYNSHPLENYPLCNLAPPGPVTVVHDGWLDESRGMTQILRAVAEARRSVDVRLLCVGSVREGTVPEYGRTVSELGLEAAVSVTGWLPYNEAGSRTATGQIGIVGLQPSENSWRGLSNKLYSYMSCGMPAIVPSGSESARVAAETGCGLAVDVTRPSEIAEAIVTLARDGALRARLGANGRRAAEETFGWHVMRRLLAKRYAEMSGTGERAG